MPRQLTTTEFIRKAKIIHNDFYDYTESVYINMHTKVKIIDPEFGEFWQTPMGHINQKQGHPGRRYIKMAEKRRKPISEFIRQARNKHGDLYDYSKVKYTTCDTKVCIIDPKYGEFWQSPYQHLNSHGCPARTKQKYNPIHKDHIIPLSILFSNTRSSDKWFKERPLYKLLNSDVNLISVTNKFNRDKSDKVTILGKTVSANTVRNNYDIISYLLKSVLKIDPTTVIKQDKEFIRSYFAI